MLQVPRPESVEALPYFVSVAPRRAHQAVYGTGVVFQFFPRRELEKPDFPITGEVLDEFTVLRIPEQDQHYWSPELTLQLHKKGQGMLIRGLFGPRLGYEQMKQLGDFLEATLEITATVLGWRGLFADPTSVDAAIAVETSTWRYACGIKGRSVSWS